MAVVMLSYFDYIALRINWRKRAPDKACYDWRHELTQIVHGNWWRVKEIPASNKWLEISVVVCHSFRRQEFQHKWLKIAC